MHAVLTHTDVTSVGCGTPFLECYGQESYTGIQKLRYKLGTCGTIGFVIVKQVHIKCYRSYNSKNNKYYYNGNTCMYLHGQSYNV